MGVQCRTFNSTLISALSSPPDTYWGNFEAISQYNAHLNFFERLWAAWYAYMQNDVLATGIMSFVMHELVYFGRSLPWIIIGQIPYFNKYKIQAVCYTRVVSSSHPALKFYFFITFLSIRTNINFYSKKCPLQPSNGIVPSLSLSPTSQSSFHKFGSFIPWLSSLASKLASPFLLSTK